MSLVSDIQYVGRLAPYLQLFKHKGGYSWNCRCPFCGDSAKKKHLARGWFFRGNKDLQDMLLYRCYNCGVATSMSKVMHTFAPELYKEYRFSSYRESNPLLDAEPSLEMFKTEPVHLEDLGVDSVLDSLKSLDELPVTHPAVQYLVKRKLPENLWHLFYFAPKFKKFTNSALRENKFKEEDDYPRLIIPFFNEHGKMFAFAARAFGQEEPKYFTIKIDENEEKIYGRERLDYSKHIYVVEGQIDSMLLPNCISVSGSSFDTPFIQGIATNCTLIPDAEPRNVEIVKQYRKYVQAGYRVCMLPETFEFKDINEAIEGGMTPSQITDLIDANSFQGLEAQIRFATWQKTDTNVSKKKPKEMDSKILQKYFRNA